MRHTKVEHLRQLTWVVGIAGLAAVLVGCPTSDQPAGSELPIQTGDEQPPGDAAPPGDALVDDSPEAEQTGEEDIDDAPADVIDLPSDAEDEVDVAAEGDSEPEPDADADGVPDEIDVCPGTAEGARIDDDGCADNQRDSDHDVVTDDVDQCPHTPPGTPVDGIGCPIAIGGGDGGSAPGSDDGGDPDDGDDDDGSGSTADIDIRLAANPGAGSPGDLFEVEVFAGNFVDLRGFEIGVDVSGGQAGTLELEDMYIDQQRPDFVFNGLDPIFSFDTVKVRMLCALMSGGVDSETDTYLTTFVFRASTDAGGTFLVFARPGDGTIALDSSTQAMDVRVTSNATIEILDANP